MEEYIAFDSHKHHTWVEHAPGAIRQALGDCASWTPEALEATLNWCWIVHEIEQAGCGPARQRMGHGCPLLAKGNIRCFFPFPGPSSNVSIFYTEHSIAD